MNLNFSQSTTPSCVGPIRDMAIPSDLRPDRMLAENAEQMRVMAQVRLDHGGDRQIAYFGHANYQQVRPTPYGYGIGMTKQK